jgi:hypothetical protein
VGSVARRVAPTVGGKLMRRLVVLVTLAVLACLVVSQGLTAAGAQSPVARSEAQNAEALAITSTLAGKRVLPHRIRWVGRANLPAMKVSKVEFLIDGKVRWIERNPPYTYGDDSNWLVTSWLSPGRHRFAVRATAKDGRKALQTTVARVVAAPAPPADLSGSWKHSFAGGIWVLTVDKTGWKIRDPWGFTNFIDVAYFSEGRLQARGGILTKPAGADPNLGGNGWCTDRNAPVDYRWTVAADVLTLTNFGVDNCTTGGDAHKQHHAWNGDWTKLR